MRVNEVMKQTVRTISPDRPLSEAADIMKRFGIDHVVVVEKHVPVGLLSDGDVLRHSGEGIVESAMSRGLVTIDAKETIARAANMMRGHAIKCLIVTEENKLAGILTSSDLLEIVGRSGHKERTTMRDRGPRKRPALSEERAIQVERGHAKAGATRGHAKAGDKNRS
jgi:CBS domain-containing protein